MMRALRRLVDEVNAIAASPRTALFLATRRNAMPTVERKPLSELRRILIVKPDEIGDFVLATPFLRELRRLAPNAHIVLVVKPDVATLAQGCPFVDQIVNYPWEKPGRFASVRRLWTVVRQTRRLQREGAFDLAILPRWDADHYQAVQWLALSGAPRRVSFGSSVAAWKRAHNLNFDDALTDAVRSPLLRHEVLQNLELLKHLGGEVANDSLCVWPHADAQGWATRRAARLAPGEPRVAIAMGARQSSKRWPAERYLAVGERLLNEGAQLVLLGSREDRALGDWPLSERVLDLRGQATLPQSAAMLETCDLYIGNDTGLKHIAAAWKKPVLEISCHPRSGSAAAWPWPDRFRAWGTPAEQVRPVHAVAPCTDGCIANDAHCIASVSVEDVWQAVHSLRSRNAQRRAA